MKKYKTLGDLRRETQHLSDDTLVVYRGDNPHYYPINNIKPTVLYEYSHSFKSEPNEKVKEPSECLILW